MAARNNSQPDGGQSASARFFQYFQYEITALQEQMDRLGDTALVGGERKDATDHCLAGITRLSSEVKDASTTLPAYDLRTYTEAIKALQDKLAETQAQHAPKPKFSFKTRKNESAVSLHEAAELAAQKQKSVLNFKSDSNVSSVSTTPIYTNTPPNELDTTQNARNSAYQPSARSKEVTNEHGSTNADLPGLTTTATNTAVSSSSNAHIILPSSTARSHTACTLARLNNCCVDLSIPTTETAPFASLTITEVHSSLLLCGSVAGPAHITGVKNSTLIISCRQLRMHECENVDVYLYCTSRPIIENCKEMRFAEMPHFYTDLLHSAHAVSNGAIGTNMWEHVDDFKWLRSEQSPNWMILPASDKVSDEVWKEIIPGKPGMSLDEILKVASIRR